jgi:hypothetical protein
VFTSVIIDTIDSALDAVLADAAVVVTTRQKARAGIDQEVPERVELCRSAQMGEKAPAHRCQALPRASGEGQLGGEVVDSSNIITPLKHALTIPSHASVKSGHPTPALA